MNYKSITPLFLSIVLFLLQPALAKQVPLGANSCRGTYQGILNVPGAGDITLYIKLNQQNDAWTGLMDVPIQQAKNLPLTVDVDGTKLAFRFSGAGIKYDGQCLNSGTAIHGTYKQGAFTSKLDFTLFTDDIKATSVQRPQTPKPPFSYTEETVVFSSKDNIKLSGTISRPKKSMKEVGIVLISGSGPSDRNMTVFGHQYFAVLSDFLTRAGYTILRYDERGIGKSTGDYKTATIVDFANDASAAISYLRTSQKLKKTGLLGISEGGLVAPMVANNNSATDFLVLLAAPSINMQEILAFQRKTLATVNNTDDKTFNQSEEITNAITQRIASGHSVEQLISYLDSLTEKQLPIEQRKAWLRNLPSIATPWFRHIVNYNPVPALSKLQRPVLALNGSLDTQVEAKTNLQVMRDAIKKNKSMFTIREMPGLNHLFQEAKSGLVSEYATIEQTISPKAISTIIQWLGDNQL